MRTTSPCGPAMDHARIFGVATLAASVLAVGAGPAQASAGRGAAASGPREFIHQLHWSVSSPARGVQLLSGTFSDPASHPSWTVTIQAPTRSPFDGSTEFAEAGTATWAQQTETALTSDPLHSRRDHDRLAALPRRSARGARRARPRR